VRAPLWALATALLAAPIAAEADEPTGCGAFRWPIESERAALSAAARPVLGNGGDILYGAPQTLKLAPFDDANLPRPPERAPKSKPSFAGHYVLPPPARPGMYKLTLTADGWIDVIDNGAFLHPSGFSGALGCDGARKSVKFDLPARTVEIQISNVKDADVGIMVTPWE
jgi:hypothetical protein